jgi:leucyl aminopeptidase
MNVARELGNLPANICTPTYLGEQAVALGKKYRKLTVKVLTEAQMKRLGMHSLLSVGNGSDQPSALIVMEYKGGKANTKPNVLVGKGITFDTGGISLKPGAGMDEMKVDMCGAASVMGTMQTLCELDASVNVVGVIASAENMPSGRATKPGDVVTSMSGQTIEVLNTDAEGRLVLADVLSYTVDQKVARLVDLATLTGACVVALGEEVTGVFTNNQEWCDQVLAAAKTCGEDAWQLPMFDHYAELIKGDVADINNTGGRWGGAITAAKCLERFVGDTPWVHLDIAGPSFASSNKPHREGGGTGCMVRTLVELAERFGTTRKR